MVLKSGLMAPSWNQPGLQIDTSMSGVLGTARTGWLTMALTRAIASSMTALAFVRSMFCDVPEVEVVEVLEREDWAAPAFGFLFATSALAASNLKCFCRAGSRFFNLALAT